MIFLKQGNDLLNLLFPGLLTFEIVKTLTGQMLYQVVFFSRLISFASEKSIRLHKKMLDDIKKFYKDFKDSFSESYKEMNQKVAKKMRQRQNKSDKSVNSEKPKSK
jgi:hypothetical protein